MSSIQTNISKKLHFSDNVFYHLDVQCSPEVSRLSLTSANTKTEQNDFSQCLFTATKVRFVPRINNICLPQKQTESHVSIISLAGLSVSLKLQHSTAVQFSVLLIQLGYTYSSVGVRKINAVFGHFYCISAVQAG